MKGLLIKDFKLMMMQKNFFLSIIAIAVVLTVFVKNPSFIIGYLTFIGSVFTLSTISYDEFDNGNAFLFSLPITRKLYALEKYVFGFLTGACSCLISLILCMIFGLIFGNYSISDSLMTAGMSFPMFLFLLLLMLPVHLKFGSEKGKIAIPRCTRSRFHRWIFICQAGSAARTWYHRFFKFHVRSRDRRFDRCHVRNSRCALSYIL